MALLSSDEDERARDEEAPARARPAPEDETACRKPGSDTLADAKEDARKAPPGAIRSAFGAARRHPVATAAILVVAVALVVGVALWRIHASRFESTDDAFIDTRVVPVSAQVAGAIVEAPVTDNQHVRAGALLARIDPRDYAANLALARGRVDQAQASVTGLKAQTAEQQARIDQARKETAQAQAALTFAQQQNARSLNLVAAGAGTRQAAQQASSDEKQKQAALDAAQAAQAAAARQLGVLAAQRDAADAQLEQARAQLDLATTNLDRTAVHAPTDGRATKISAAVGLYAQPGQALLMFVPDEAWVTANFKENQLADLRPGQSVDIEIDAYPGRVFKGRVDSIQKGSGAAFSLLPAENATGNYVKVVQRIPVKITFDEKPDVYIGPGMSVVPTVHVK